MFDKTQALDLLGDAVAELARAKETLDTIKKEDGEVEKLKPKRNAVKKALESAEAALASLGELVAAAEIPEPEPEPEPEPKPEPEPEPEPESEPEPGPEPEPEPEPEPDLFSVEDQHAVSKLMQDTKVHLAVQRRRDFWEIRHRNTADGAPSEPIREKTIAECYAVYEREAVRGAGFQPFVPRRLTLEEQRALVDMRNMPIDNPRSVRWEDGMTEVDYIDKSKQPAGGRKDDVQFPAGELVGPVEFMKTVLG